MKKTILLSLFCVTAAVVAAQTNASSAAKETTFTNPLLPGGADPWSIYKDGYYYYTNTTSNRIVIWKTKNLTDLKTAEQKTIYTPPKNTDYSRDLWAPEIHFIDGKWYVYYTARGDKLDHRMYVLENAGADPMQGEWTFKGKITDPTDKWAIDASVFSWKKKWYIIWSGWEGDVNRTQNIYIARLKNPWTIDGERVKLSYPLYDWEKDGDINNATEVAHVDVNEGPQALMHNGRLFIIYSASGCWTDNYALGMLSFKGGKNLLDTTAWQKSTQPVFKKSIANGVYAPGHNSFFVSPNGKEHWILYHANAKSGQGCGGHRSPRAQRFTWRKDGTPDFGEPLPTTTVLPVPAMK